MNEMKARELIASLARDCERFYLDAEIYKAVLRSAETNPQIAREWRAHVDRLKAHSPSDVQERIGAKFGVSYDFAVEGLDHDSAQKLLDRVQRLHDDLQ